MNNIKIVNDELAAKWKNKNIVFDYDGKTFFYEGYWLLIIYYKKL